MEQLGTTVRQTSENAHQASRLALDASNATDDMIKMVIEEGYTRMPVYIDSVDNVIGVVYSDDHGRTWRSGTPVGVGFGILAYLPLLGTALWAGKLDLEPGAVAAMSVVMVASSIPFCANACRTLFISSTLA